MLHEFAIVVHVTRKIAQIDANSSSFVFVKFVFFGPILTKYFQKFTKYQFRICCRLNSIYNLSEIPVYPTFRLAVRKYNGGTGTPERSPTGHLRE